MKILAIANAKGGTGKTTLAVHLATGLIAKGQRVLLVDLDPQGNASGWLLGPLPQGAKGVADVLTRAAPPSTEELHPAPGRDGLLVLPSTPALAGADIALAAEVGGEMTLAEALRPLSSKFDTVVLDCPPTLGLTVLSALCAADGVIAPVLPAFLALTGLRKLEDTCARIRARLHVRTHVLGYVLFAVDGRESIASEAREVLRRDKGDRLFSSEIRVSAAAKALPAHRQCAWDPGADARGAEDYPAVLKEVLQRMDRELTVTRAKRARAEVQQ